MRTNELILYKNMEEGQLLQDMVFLMEEYENEYYNREDLAALLADVVNGLIELAVSHGFEGNLWHTYLTSLYPVHAALADFSTAIQAICRLYPPVTASKSRTSPAKYSPGAFFDSMVPGSISFTATPPWVMMASLKPRRPVRVKQRLFVICTRAWRSSRVTAFTRFSGSMPLLRIITGISFAG